MALKKINITCFNLKGKIYYMLNGKIQKVKEYGKSKAKNSDIK